MSSRRIKLVEVVIWIFVILLVALVLSPYAVGFKVKADYQRSVDQYALLSQYDVQIEQYQQGFYTSDVTLRLSLPELDQPLVLQEVISHGPLNLGLFNQGKSPFTAAVVKGELDTVATDIPLLSRLFNQQSPLIYQHVLGFDGALESQFYIPAIRTVLNEDNGRHVLESSGALLTQFMQAQSLKGELSVPHIKLLTPSANYSAQGVLLNFSVNEGVNQVLVGDGVAAIKSLLVDVDKQQFALRDFTLRTVTADNQQLIDTGTQLSVREVLASNQKFGPLTLNLSVNGLNAQSLLQLQGMQSQVKAMQNQGIPQEQVNAMIFGQVLSLLPELIRQAAVTINPLSVNSELGRLEADMDLSLSGIDSNTPADPMFLLQAINLDLNLSIEKPLIRQMINWNLLNNGVSASATEMNRMVDENLALLKRENWLVQEGSTYHSKIAMHKGQLQINGMTMDPVKTFMSSDVMP
ncbi:MAG TPA: DUF945 family protein [Gammaproteobacteria bacterium]